MNNRVVIVVPIWKTQLNFHEYNSIRRLFDVVGGKYDIVTIYPEFLDLSWYQKHFDFTEYYKFWAYYFSDNISYSRLMLLSDFYRYFVDNYDYMLIYQTDAWMFKDELEYWINKGYDYIGAPFMFRYPSAQGYGVQNHLYNGNGGVSLRNIQWMIDNLERINGEISIDGVYEDIYISLHFEHNNNPLFSECMQFAWDGKPDLLWQMNQFNTPFCCHNYIGNGYDFYKDMNLITYYKFEDDLCRK